jgi:hypothetical protein
VSGSTGRLVWRNISGSGIIFGTLLPLVMSAPIKPCETALAAGTANDGPGVAASWTTGNKVAVGTSAEETSKVWFTVASGITTEIFYPRLDIPNMQYIVTDGSTFVDLERDATIHEISMPDEKALEYTVTNTDKRATPKYRITNTYITDPSQNTLLIRTRFQSLDGNSYQLYLLENASMAGGGANNNAWWDETSLALMSSGTETLFGSSTTVVSALKVASPNGFVAHENGYSGVASDCYVELREDKLLKNQFDNIASTATSSSAAKSVTLAPTRRSPLLSAMGATRYRLSRRQMDRLRQASPIASAPIGEFLRTAGAGTAMSTRSPRHPPAYRATHCVAASITSPR